MRERRKTIIKTGAPLPENVETDKLTCVTLAIPDEPEYRRAFLGQVWAMGRWFFWEKSGEPGDRRAKKAAEVWRNALERFLCMGSNPCCCDDRQTIPRQDRYQPDGTLEVSFDGGATWEDGTNYDPRFTAPQWPQPVIGDDREVRCFAANNIAAEFKTALEEAIDTINASAGILAVIGVLVKLLIFLAIIGTAGLATIPVLIAASGLVAFSASALNAAFTSEVWAIFERIIYCNLEDDGIMTPEGWENAKNQISSELTGIAPTHLINVMNIVGPVGLTNIGRTDSGEYTETNCDCGPEMWCHTFDFSSSDGGFEQGDLGANYVPGSGWHTIYSTYAQGHIARIRRDWTTPATIHKATLEFTWDGTPPNPGRTIAYGSFSLGADGGSPYTVESTVNDASGIIITIGNGGGFSTVEGTITRLTVWGEGYNPFGGSNCT